jgi:hypothetical protein
LDVRTASPGSKEKHCTWQWKPTHTLCTRDGRCPYKHEDEQDTRELSAKAEGVRKRVNSGTKRSSCENLCRLNNTKTNARKPFLHLTITTLLRPSKINGRADTFSAKGLRRNPRHRYGSRVEYRCSSPLVSLLSCHVNGHGTQRTEPLFIWTHNLEYCFLKNNLDIVLAKDSIPSDLIAAPHE